MALKNVDYNLFEMIFVVVLDCMSESILHIKFSTNISYEYKQGVWHLKLISILKSRSLYKITKYSNTCIVVIS